MVITYAGFAAVVSSSSGNRFLDEYMKSMIIEICYSILYSKNTLRKAASVGDLECCGEQ